MFNTRFKKTFWLFIVSALVAIGLSIIPAVQAWEENLGLSWLFHARGIQQAPDSVVVVTIDKSSSEYFQLPNLTSKWPRSLHAQLLSQLYKAGAKAVAFDIHFRSPRDDAGDRKLAKAIETSGNVVLFSFLQKQVVEAVDLQGRVSKLVMDELIAPVEVIANAAAVLAPNPLPKVPVKVSQFWKFVPEAGDAPTLPVMGFHLYHFESLFAFTRLFSEVTGQDLSAYMGHGMLNKKMLAALVTKMHETFIKQPHLRQAMREAINDSSVNSVNKALFKQFLALYEGEASQYINYYGPARSIKTIPYYEILKSDDALQQVRDKLVFVGFSESRQWEQQDGFYSVYSDEEGLDISGVEITATAAANLLDGSSVRAQSLGMHFLMLLFISAVLVCVYYFSRGAWLPVGLAITGLLYFLIAWQLFSYNGVWLPLLLPFLTQFPIVLLLGMTWNYQELNNERKNIQRAFGYYLPESEVNRLARDMTDHSLGGELMHGTCLSTDAQQYTTLSEKMTPQELSVFMNDYYEVIFRPVRLHEGIISDVVGDSVMALWASPVENLQQRQQAVTAALDILDRVNEFNTNHPDHELPTRIGLHYGAMMIGHVGAMDHYEYRAVGDIVNTGSRIEGMSKYLGVKLLVSADVIDGLPDIHSRYVGEFTLKGKTVALGLYEIVCGKIYANSTTEPLWTSFAEALSLFEKGKWGAAASAFAGVLDKYPDDGPSQFYLNYCQQNKNTAPENWHGVMNMQDK